MKIIGGKLKGKNFYMPADIRPTQNIARRALFDIVGHDLTGVTFLDLFAGSGAIGLEGLSRGAKHVILVEHNDICLEIIQQNLDLLIKNTQITLGQCEIIPGDAFAMVKSMARGAKTFDLVFADPPYGLELGKKALKTLGTHDILHPNSVVVIQHEKEESLPHEEGFLILYKEKQYGKTVFSIYNKK